MNAVDSQSDVSEESTDEGNESVVGDDGSAALELDLKCLMFFFSFLK